MDHVALDTIHDIRDDRDVSEEQAAPSLADQRAAVTREAILKATQNLLVNEHPAAISVPAVAVEAGVSVRTIYRYFPNKQALLDAIANYFPDRADVYVAETFESMAGSQAALIRLWSMFDENRPAVRAEHMSPAGSELRQRRLTETRTQIHKFVSTVAPVGSEADRERATDAVVAVSSSSMFLELTDRLGYAGPDAARLAIWMASALIEKFAADHAEEGPTP